MTLNTFSAKVTGNPDESGWSQVHEFQPREEKLQTRGKIFAIVSIESKKDGIAAVEVGREVLTRLHEEYYGKVEKSAFDAITQAVDKVTNEFKSQNGEIEIAAAGYVGGIIYVAASGGAKIVIFRNGILAEILQSESETISASGHPQENDILIIGTKDFYNVVSQGSLKASLEGGNIQQATESISPTIRAQDKEGRCAAVFVKFAKEVGNDFEKAPQKEEVKIKIGKRDKNGLWRRLVEKLPERKLYIKGSPEQAHSAEKRRKLAVSVGILMIILLGVSIVFGVRKNAKEQRLSKYEPRLEEALHNFNESKELISLDKEKARDLFVESRVVADRLLEEGVEDERLRDLVAKLEENEGEVLGIYSQDSQLFVNLSLLSDGFGGSEMVSTLDKVYVLDKDSEKIVGIDIGTKRSEVEAGPSELDSPQSFAAYADSIYAMEDGSIYEINDEKQEVIDNAWGDDVLISSYAGNLYVLDKAAGSILRFSGTQSGFSSGSEWLASGIEVDFKEVKDWTIDGSIWILSQNRYLEKFQNGVPINIDISSVSPAIQQIDSIYSNEELDYLYLLDKSEKRIVVIDKEGEYVAQYLSEELSNATDIVVSESESKILFLTGDKLLFLEIRHI